MEPRNKGNIPRINDKERNGRNIQCQNKNDTSKWKLQRNDKRQNL